MKLIHKQNIIVTNGKHGLEFQSKLSSFSRIGRETRSRHEALAKLTTSGCCTNPQPKCGPGPPSTKHTELLFQDGLTTLDQVPQGSTALCDGCLNQLFFSPDPSEYSKIKFQHPLDLAEHDKSLHNHHF